MSSRNHQIFRPDGCIYDPEFSQTPFSYRFLMCHRVWRFWYKKAKTKCKKKSLKKFDKFFFVYIIKPSNKKNDILFTKKKHMETKIKSCEVLRNKSKCLRVDYCKEPDLFKRSEILRKRKRTVEKMMKVQSEISQLLLDELKNHD